MPDRDFLGHTWAVWLAVLTGIVLRVWAEPPKGETPIRKVIALSFSAACGFAIGLNFYTVVIEWRGLSPETWDVPIAMLLALTGESFVRFIINIWDWEKVKEVMSIWRGKGGSNGK